MQSCYGKIFALEQEMSDDKRRSLAKNLEKLTTKNKKVLMAKPTFADTVKHQYETRVQFEIINLAETQEIE